MIRNKNSKVVIIPRAVEKILNNPVCETTAKVYDEYEPEITKSDVAEITKKLSTNYSYVFLEDVPDIRYMGDNGKSKYEKLNTIIIAYTCGELRFVYHSLKNFTHLLNKDLEIENLIQCEAYDKLIPFELALIILNQYDLNSNTYAIRNIKEAVDYIKTNAYYKHIDLSEHTDEIMEILKNIIKEEDLKEALKS